MTAFAQLDRLFDPAKPGLTEEGARMLADLHSDPEVADRMQGLAIKANEGTLTAVESREYESWVRTGTLLSVLQAKARLYLKRIGKS